MRCALEPEPDANMAMRFIYFCCEIKSNKNYESKKSMSITHALFKSGENYKFPLSSCSLSMDSKSALKLPFPNEVAPLR